MSRTGSTRRPAGARAEWWPRRAPGPGGSHRPPAQGGRGAPSAPGCRVRGPGRDRCRGRRAETRRRPEAPARSRRRARSGCRRRRGKRLWVRRAAPGRTGACAPPRRPPADPHSGRRNLASRPPPVNRRCPLHRSGRFRGSARRPANPGRGGLPVPRPTISRDRPHRPPRAGGRRGPIRAAATSGPLAARFRRPGGAGGRHRAPRRRWTDSRCTGRGSPTGRRAPPPRPGRGCARGTRSRS